MSDDGDLRDRATLNYGLSDHEAAIADAARRMALRQAAEWLADKSAKSELFPGENLVHAKGRAAAYRNASQEMLSWVGQSYEISAAQNRTD